MLQQLKQNLEQHLTHIVRERDPFFASEGHFYVKEYIRQELGNFGEVTSYYFVVKGRVYENLILDLPTNITDKPPILIGAHYDTVPGSPGADDNGTGVATLLELARFFSQNSANFPIRLVAFDMEEYGLNGSIAYANDLKQQKQQLRLMLSLEMLGYCDHSPNSQKYPTGLKYFYPSTGNFIALIGNLKTIPDLINIRHKIRENNALCEYLPVPLGGYIVPDTRRSDHSPFWSRGYRAMMVTDTANLRNPYYHTPQDTINTINLEFLTGVCYGLARGIQAI